MYIIGMIAIALPLIVLCMMGVMWLVKRDDLTSNFVAVDTHNPKPDLTHDPMGVDECVYPVRDQEQR